MRIVKFLPGSNLFTIDKKSVSVRTDLLAKEVITSPILIPALKAILSASIPITFTPFKIFRFLLSSDERDFNERPNGFKLDS